MSNYCSLFGHSDFWSSADLECRIKSEIIDCVENRNLTEFLLGGYGGYDITCAKYIRELKTIYPQIKSYLVLAYLDKKFDEYDKDYIKKTFDDIIYPPIENVPKRFAISKRNEWMIDNSDYVIFYVNHSWGGASKMLEYATRKKKDYINFGNK